MRCVGTLLVCSLVVLDVNPDMHTSSHVTCQRQPKETEVYLQCRDRKISRVKAYRRMAMLRQLERAPTSGSLCARHQTGLLSEVSFSYSTLPKSAVI